MRKKIKLSTQIKNITDSRLKVLQDHLLRRKMMGSKIINSHLPLKILSLKFSLQKVYRVANSIHRRPLTAVKGHKLNKSRTEDLIQISHRQDNSFQIMLGHFHKIISNAHQHRCP